MKFPLEGAGKGDKQRPTDKKKYDESYERIFGNKKTKKQQLESDKSDVELNRD